MYLKAHEQMLRSNEPTLPIIHIPEQWYRLPPHLVHTLTLHAHARRVRIYIPRSKSPGLETDIYGAYELAKAGGVHRINLVGGAVPEVVVVQSGARQAHSLSRLVVLQQPLDLQREGREGEGREKT